MTIALKLVMTLGIYVVTLSWNSPWAYAEGENRGVPATSPLVSQAQEAYKKGDYKKAQDLLSPETATLSEPGLKLLALTYRKLKNYPQEVQTLKLLIEKSPETASYQLSIADAYTLNHQENEAIASLRKAVELSPDQEDPYTRLLAIFLSTKNNYESRTLLETMAHRFGQKPPYLIDLCRLYFEAGFLTQAEQACLLSNKKSPTHPDSHVYLAWAYRDQNDPQKAKSTLLPAAEKFPNSEFILWATGDLLYKDKNFGAAEKYFLKSSTVDPTSSRSQLGLALSRFEQNKWEEAVSPFEKACASNIEATSAFRVSARKLAQKGEIRLSSRYESALGKCKK